MKFGSHKAITASVAVFMDVPMTGIVVMTLGGVLPDVIDMSVSLRNDTLFSKIHRTLSHWWALWLALIGLIWVTPMPVIFGVYVADVLLWLCYGSVVHIVLDSLTYGGVPLLNPFKQSFGFRFFPTGSPAEYIVVALLTTVLLYTGISS
jgi:membrane-bound metal-dependent hydrolase YbcI (DUF457 family)